MQAQELRQLIPYSQALALSGVSRRTFFRRLATGDVPVYVDPADRRKRWLDRRDVVKLKIARHPEHGADTAA